VNVRVFAGRRKLLFAGLILLGLIHAAAATGLGSLARRLVDGGGHATGGVVIGAFTGLAVALGVLLAVQRGLEEALGQDYALELRLALFDDAVIAEGAQTAGSDHQARRLLPFLGDLTAQRRWVGAGLGRMTVGIVTTIAVLGLIALLRPALAGGVALALAAGLAATFALAAPLRRSNEDLRGSRAALAGFVGDRLAAATVIRAMGGLTTERRKLARRAELMVRFSLRRAAIAGGARGIAAITGSLMLLAVLLAGAAEVGAGAMTAGAVVGVLGQIGLMTAALADLAQAFELRQAAQAASLSMRRRLARTEAAQPQPKGRRRGLMLLSVSRLRLGAKEPAFNAEADVGDLILVAGAGARRLTPVLAGVAAASAGCVRLKGRDVVGLGATARRRLIGVASPETGLLRGSLGMNLRYRAGAASDEQIAEVIDICGLRSLIARLPGGLSAVIAPGGSNLTAAERDALVIARAMLGRPALLVLDSVDGRLPERVARSIAAALAAWPGIVVLVAERPDWRALANRTWTVRRSSIREAGIRGSLQPSHPESEPCQP